MILERCNCTLSKSSLAAVDLTGDSGESDDDHTPASNHVWLKNVLYTLNDGEWETIESPSRWLNDNVILAAQMLILQQFPHMSGLQPPTLAHAGHGFPNPQERVCSNYLCLRQPLVHYFQCRL